MELRLNRSFVLLDGAQTVESALRRMDRLKDADWIVVRRRRGAQVYWYVYDASKTRGDFAEAPGKSVDYALDLHEWKRVAPHTLGTTGPAPEGNGTIVLTPSGQVAGVTGRPVKALAEPPTTAEAAGPDAELGMPEGGMAKAKPPGAPQGERTMIRRAARGPAPEAPPVRRRRAPHAGAILEPQPTAPFRAQPDLEAPLAVEDGRSFDLVVGFSRDEVAGVTGGPIVLPDMPPEFDLQVQLVAMGFECANGNQHAIHVVRDEPEREKLRLSLTAKIGPLPAGETIAHRVLGVIFSFRGMPCGIAQRNIIVAQPGAMPSQADLESDTSFARQPVRSTPVWAHADVSVPDLTVTLSRYDGDTARANFAWTFESPHHVALPAPVACEIPDDAASYARGITSEIVELGESPLLGNHIRGSGIDIADHVPNALWTAIAEVSGHLEGRSAPDVFFLTEESCIPWELAVMPKPLDPAKPELLGAQVNLGRWIIGDPTPHVPPTPSVDVGRIVVIYGDYPQRIGPLPEALEERDCLHARYAATTVEIKDEAVAQVLAGTAPDGGCEVLHFACHGEGDPTRPAYSRLVMHDGAPLTDNVLRGAALGGRNKPFLFLNACETGSAGEELGEVSGFVEAALKSGFSGFVGGLWQVESATARDIAIEFYKRTLEQRVSVAEAMREIRCRFRFTDPVPNDTYLAYVFYGHPGLKLRRN